MLVGGVTPVLFAISWVLREALGLSDAEYWTGFTFYYAAHLLNDPHFAVTYLLFYEDGPARAFGRAFSPVQRVRYWLAGVVVPLALVAWAVFAIRDASAARLGLMIQLMFFLVGWHYVKQGFGVMTVLSAQRGVRYTDLERRVILLHCYAGWAYAWATPYDPGHAMLEKGVELTTLGHPTWLEPLAAAVFGASVVALVITLLRKRHREGRLPILTPLTGLLCSIWAWSIYASYDPLVRYAIPALHSIQYLYFVWLLKRNQAVEREAEPYFETSARTRLTILAVGALGLGYFFFDLAPGVLDTVGAPPVGRANGDLLGPTPWFAALYAIVNIHHFCMDAVIWRRDNPLTRYLAQPALPQK